MEFNITDNPPWSRRSNKLSSEMLSKISENLSRYKNIPKSERVFIDFVLQSNLGEDVGTQSEEETKEVNTCSKDTALMSINQRETFNTFRALQMVVELQEDMDHTGMITVQQICDIHRILMNGLHRNCGKIRDTQVYVDTADGERYYYTSPELVEDRLYGVVDQHNIHMKQLQELNGSDLEKWTFLVKSAAWFLFNFVDTHPFSDGNGRMCRLLAGYTIMVMSPFPVHPYHTNGNGSRQDYLNAVITCRRDTAHEPSLISALLIDGLYTTSKLYLGG